ncbi:MAG: outer membrane protein assembly factor BamD, partial [Bacteroidales bacterium]|nr:outer membrane protein assembly factor BamD [Bacteroidales bacterium]
MFRKNVFIALVLLLTVSSCSKYQRLVKSTDYEEKYQMAMVFYEQTDYYRALQLFDQLLPFYRGTDRAERLSYYYAYAHYHQRDYVLGSFYFKRFAKTFPRSQFAEECAFMSAYCQYLDSPKHSLDQTNTNEAIKELQLFINMYPQSGRIEECNRLIDNLRAKLELKDMEIARLYFKMENYTAAITAFKNVLKAFPETRFREEIMLSILR